MKPRHLSALLLPSRGLTGSGTKTEPVPPHASLPSFTPSLRAKLRGQDLRRGAVIVEAALVVPLFLVLVFGIIEFGRVYHVYQVLTNAAREGARFAVSPCPFTANISGICSAGQLPSTAQVQTRVNDYLGTGNVTGATVTVVNNYSQLVNNVNLTYTRVQVSLPYQVVFFGYTPTLRADAVMRNETN